MRIAPPAEGLPSVLRGLLRAGLAGILGAQIGWVVYRVGNPELVRTAGEGFGTTSPAGGWLALTALGILFAIPFVAVVSRSVDAFVREVIALTSQSDLLRSALVPLLHRSAMGLALFPIGLAYGLAVGVVVFAMAVPVSAILAAERTMPPLFLDPFGMIGSTVYGGGMGLCYGLLAER